MTKLFPEEDINFKASDEVYTDENGAKYEVDRDTHDHDMTYENEQSMVTILSHISIRPRITNFVNFRC